MPMIRAAATAEHIDPRKAPSQCAIVFAERHRVAGVELRGLVEFLVAALRSVGPYATDAVGPCTKLALEMRSFQLFTDPTSARRSTIFPCPIASLGPAEARSTLALRRAVPISQRRKPLGTRNPYPFGALVARITKGCRSPSSRKDRSKWPMTTRTQR